MNDERRMKIAALVKRLENIKAAIGELFLQERTASNATPKDFQQSEHGQRSETATDDLDEAAKSVSTAIDHLEDARLK